MTSHRARITWLSAAEGGRQHPPRGGRYCPTMRIVRRPDELRSLVIEGLPESEDVMSAEVRGRLLFPENAPPDAMDPGAEFEVFEGPRLVARGTVGGEAEAVDSARPPP